MAGNPEKGEVAEGEKTYRRVILEENLYLLHQQRSPVTGETSLQLLDGTELLSLIHIDNRQRMSGPQFNDDELNKKFRFLNFKSKDLGENDTEAKQRERLRKRRDGHPIAKLSRELKDHWILETPTFESKVKETDRMVLVALEALRKNKKSKTNKKGYEFGEGFDAMDAVISQSVVDKKEFRTRSLLKDFNKCLEQLGDTEVWLQVDQRGISFAARLAGFTIHGTGFDTAVEAVVYDMYGTKGLLPEHSFAAPQLYFRVKDGELVNPPKTRLAPPAGDNLY
jgi:hypothetical protein